jgi:Transposase zinc-binding domain
MVSRIGGGGHKNTIKSPPAPHYRICRNRHCPKCEGAQALAWMEERKSELLAVPYFHVVFTLPGRIADIAYTNKAVIYDLLFKASSRTMCTIAADPKRLGVRIGFYIGAPHLGLRDDASPQGNRSGLTGEALSE